MHLHSFIFRTCFPPKLKIQPLVQLLVQNVSGQPCTRNSVRAENVLYSWIDAAAYNHTNMCVSMEEYQAHFTFSSLHATTTCISRSRRLLDRTEPRRQHGRTSSKHHSSTQPETSLVYTAKQSTHTHSHTSTKMWVAANAARVMEGLFAKILLR